MLMVKSERRAASSEHAGQPSGMYAKRARRMGPRGALRVLPKGRSESLVACGPPARERG